MVFATADLKSSDARSTRTILVSSLCVLPISYASRFSRVDRPGHKYEVHSRCGETASRHVAAARRCSLHRGPRDTACCESFIFITVA